MSPRTIRSLVVTLVVTLVASLVALSAGAQTFTAPITEFQLSTNTSPDSITVGGDGNLWFAEQLGIGRITPAGVVTEFVLWNRQIGGVGAGPDGNIWFGWYPRVGAAAYNIARMAPDGTVTDFPTSGTPRSIASGSDGNVWFTTLTAIGRIAPSGGTVTYFNPLSLVSRSAQLGPITAGGDGNLWFTLLPVSYAVWPSPIVPPTQYYIGRITPAGAMTLFPLPTMDDKPGTITAGPDGNVWFTDSLGIGRITPAGTITEFSVGATAIASGPDGNLWIADERGNRIERVTTSGTNLAVFPIASTLQDSASCGYGILSSCPTSIVAGPDRNLWFTQPFANQIGRIDGTAQPGGSAALVWSETRSAYYGGPPVSLDVGIWSAGAGVVRSETTLARSLPLSWQVAGAGDLDGNGTADIVWRNTTTGDVTVWLMSGVTVTAIPVISSGMPLNWQIAGVADLNGDGRADLIWRDTTTGALAVWWMNGATVNGIPTIASAVPLAWQIAGFADLDGDGKADIVWRNTQTGDVAIWLMSAEQVKALPVIATGVPLSWQIAGVGDTDGDGRADIVWRNSQSGDVAIWLMNGTTILSIPVIAQGVPLEWAIRKVVDVDGDGKADLVWRRDTRVVPQDQLYNEVAFWLLNGATVRSARVVHAATGAAMQIK